MKKLSLYGIIALLLISMLAIPALAAQSATMSVSASKNTVYRGDTITVTVSTSKVDNCTSGGFMFSYDKNVFEYVSGSAMLSGYTAGVSTAAGNVAGYFMNGNATVQGGIFQITLKVKDNAAFGSYTISGVPNMSTADGAVSCSAGSTTVTVSCKHSYGNWSKLDDTNHGKTCSICQNVQKEAHKWDKGTTIKPANCKEGGQVKYNCTVCSATKKEDTAKTTDHKYGSWTKVNDTTHKHTCSVCSKEESANHTWDSGKVTKQPNCKEIGTKTFTCSGCKATKTEDIPKTTDHKYGNWTKVSDTQHKHTCSVCSKEETVNHTWNSGTVTKKATCKEAGEKKFTCTGCNATKTEEIPKLTTHTYNNDCDTDCDVCGLTRTISHKFSAKWSADKENHWHECTVCKEKKDSAKHTPGAEPTEYTAQTCTTCGYVIKAALGHKHNYAQQWTTNDAGHWYVCSGCAEKGSYADHAFENGCDTDCSICGFTRETSHAFAEDWETDAEKHWHICANCDVKQDEAAHEAGAEATETTAQICTICGYEIAPALGESETEPATEPNTAVPDATEPTSGQPTQNEEAGFPIWILIVVGVLVVGATVIVIIKKKKA